MSENAFHSARQSPATPAPAYPAYNRSLLYALALALSIAVVAVSAALAWDQMKLVIDNIQRRNFVAQLDLLKDSQRKLIYSLDQTARLHSRLLDKRSQRNACDTELIFPGELNPAQMDEARHLHTELFVTTTLTDTGCASSLRLLRKLSGSLAFSIHNLWNYAGISNYTFDLNGSFLAESKPLRSAIAENAQPDDTISARRKRIAAATAPLWQQTRYLRGAGKIPVLPFLAGLHPGRSGAGNVLSIGAPIYYRDELYAISAIDIERRVFDQIFMPAGRLPGFFVFDTSRASPVLLNETPPEERPLAQSILKHWRAINTIAHEMSATKIGHRFYLAEAIADTPWVAIYSFSFGDIFVASESLWRWIGFSMFGALLLLWSGIYLIKRYMLTPLDVAAQRLAASEELNRTIIATAPVGLCMLNLQTMQAPLANDLARSYAQRWGRHPDLALSIVDAYRAVSRRDAADRRGGTVLYTELPPPRHADAPPLLAAFSLVQYQECEVLLCGLSDITNHKQAEAMLRQARQSADEANAAKSMFLATISHEIRTPLHGAMGNLELLGNTHLSPSQRSTIGIIDRSFFSLLQIINNVLDLSKAEAGQLHLSSEIFDPIRLLEDVALTFAPGIAKKKVDFLCLLDRRLPHGMVGDEARLRQIFNNLLSNAVKFTGKGKIVMRADVSALSADECAFTVRIIDSGIGISASDRENLFRPFQQANKTIAGAFGGTGLGLSLVKNLCEEMGGTIEISGREREGAVFTVALKLPVATGCRKDSGATASAALAGVGIALSCDDPLWCRHLREQLETHGAAVADFDAWEDPSLAHNDTVLIACQDHREAAYLARLPRLAQYARARHVLMTPLGPVPPEQQNDWIRISALSKSGLLQAVDPAFDIGSVSKPAGAPKPQRAAAISEMASEKQRRMDLRDMPAAPVRPAAPAAILLVDDDLVNVTLAQQQLAILGHRRIDLARNGKEALEKCAKHDYCLILTDQFMPEMDGNLLAATLREKAYPAIIVMITASRPSPADRKNLDAVLLKPVSVEQLKTALSSHCPALQPSAAARMATAPTAASAKIAADAPSGTSILWAAFVQDYANTMDLLELGARNNDRAQCLQQLHKLKGALEILQQPLAKRVARLERRSKKAPFVELGKAYGGLRRALDRLIASAT